MTIDDGDGDDDTDNALHDGLHDFLPRCVELAADRLPVLFARHSMTKAKLSREANALEFTEPRVHKASLAAAHDEHCIFRVACECIE